MPAACDVETSTNRRQRPGPTAIAEAQNKTESFDGEQTPAETFSGHKPRHNTLYVSPSAESTMWLRNEVSFSGHALPPDPLRRAGIS